MNDETSPFLFCNLAVRQGLNLSPFLFSMNINDKENFMHERHVNGLRSITNDLEEDLFVFSKLFFIIGLRHCHTNRVNSRFTTCVQSSLFSLTSRINSKNFSCKL